MQQNSDSLLPKLQVTLLRVFVLISIAELGSAVTGRGIDQIIRQRVTLG